ncbi:MAG TPA: hypothetical protein VNT20_00395 [Flavisolibacter sp.]|jgi:hypothetical protein|nr:hypothetical protein [Flavisolibacter sp.]
MSFEANDMNMIHLGNYEEFFILYMDNELSEGQVKMVDEFLVANPDLKSEFEILMSTKLPLEDFSFDKKDLLAENMKLTSVDEELLLYIDNELASDKKKTIELEIASNKDYQLQHQVLLQTKLDPSEKIEYPNKKELYRRTERVITMRVWMRVAAAVMLFAIAGILVFKKPPSITPANGGDRGTAGVNSSNQKKSTEKKDTAIITQPSFDQNNLASNERSEKEIKSNKNIEKREVKDRVSTPQNLTAYNKPQQTSENLDRTVKTNVQFVETNNVPTVEHKVSVNNPDVTSSLLARNTIETPVETKESTESDRKGSLKGFLRKATRMIEKRTGIDPTNENGELLIGAVAINLK